MYTLNKFKFGFFLIFLFVFKFFLYFNQVVFDDFIFFFEVKSCLFLSIINKKCCFKKTLITNFEKDVKRVFDRSIKKSDIINNYCFLFFINEVGLTPNKLKIALNSEDISFYYYIPSYENMIKKHLLLISFKKESLLKFVELFSFYESKSDDYEIVDILTGCVKWEETNLLNHYMYCKNDDLIIISHFLDLISNNNLSHIPETWDV